MNHLRKKLAVFVITTLAALTAFAAGTPKTAHADPQYSGSCPQVKTQSKNFAFGPNTATVTMNLYASVADDCFNGYERIYVSSGSGVFGSDTQDNDWIQYWINTGSGYVWASGLPDNEVFECSGPGGNGGLAAALYNFGSQGQCNTGNAFSWPNNSFAWVGNNWATHAGYCYLIQNSPNDADPYDIPEVVYSNTNKVTYQVPNISLAFCL